MNAHVQLENSDEEQSIETYPKMISRVSFRVNGDIARSETLNYREVFA